MTPAEELLTFDQQDLRRHLSCVESAQSSSVLIDGCKYLNFSSNDYLGLATNDEVQDAFIDGIKTWGSGTGASRLISGTQTPHLLLESMLARLKGKKTAKIFANGYSTSLGVLGAIAGKKDVIILDKLSHASLIDGARLSGAVLRVFPHNDIVKLETLLETYKSHSGRVIVVTESVFSMDGDTAHLEKITELKSQYNFFLLLDEAHAVGVIGAGGLATSLALEDKIDFHMGTLGKAVGVSGGYVACSEELAELIVNKSRSFIYSTAIPAAQCLACMKSLEIIHSEVGDRLREQLWSNIKYFSEALQLDSTKIKSAIIPYIIGESSHALQVSERLRGLGFLVPAVRYPTVAKGSARLRITFSAAHTCESIDQLAEALRAATID